MKQVYSIESFGAQAWGCQIWVNETTLEKDEPLTEAQAEAVYKAHELLQDAFATERIRRDPQIMAAAQGQKDRILGLFAGRLIWVDEIPNGYCSRYCCKHLPWFEVRVFPNLNDRREHITIGWRKRVLHIGWLSAPPAAELFLAEDVTKGEKSIHAWSYEKAQEYINRILA